MSKFTAGPWVVGTHKRIISSGWPIEVADGSPIAYVLGERSTELRANARLIAQAPEMHRLLTLVSAARARQDRDFDTALWYEQVRGVLSKLEGESE